MHTRSTFLHLQTSHRISEPNVHNSRVFQMFGFSDMLCSSCFGFVSNFQCSSTLFFVICYFLCHHVGSAGRVFELDKLIIRQGFFFFLLDLH